MPAVLQIDVVSIFPAYLAPLDLSLIGKARSDGLIDVRVHDLRDFTHDRHRTVDDTPYGGGAGMVMQPEPWARALEHVVGQRGSAASARPRLLVPGPGGVPFTQAMARELAAEPWLAFACGRYEGIDERVYEFAQEDLGLEVTVVSLGDYVVNGGEVAVLAIVEALARLVPGVIGNAASLVEESHQDGLLEYPLYTKPRHWRGRVVPEVLLSGDHAAIADWRHRQRLARTADRRPDLLHASSAGADVDVRVATAGDLPELLTLLYAAGTPTTMESLREGLSSSTTWLARRAGRLLGAIRVEARGDTLWLAAPALVPDLDGDDLARRLLDVAQQTAVSGIRQLVVDSPRASAVRARTYRQAGYRLGGGHWVKRCSRHE
ncbi:MAG: tRNA (guanosine(37)-N1)-methyltransferase TrmD [Intrasporangium sp.]|uniref:tRNA (guanosine(37)-N1)-methyltransferase TrmD n=1 Tax=Intrasporangium sp. TaxID=1925024 RepID=UPI002648BE6E|nr:tRNA (guanosine(37)-N1)-methyltransferase TrmD [Intrasporangium sp.]MDN5795011.1 tRNA (guanosine(37)-N1)-methyltransferase TrmD [Intrasporangium sp.]